MVLDSPLQRDYYYETSTVDALGNHLSDALGVIHGGIKPSSTDLFDAPLDFVKPLFASAFVDYVLLDGQAIPASDAVPYLPYYDEIQNASMYAALAQKWSCTRLDTKELANHQHLLAGAATAVLNQVDYQLGDSAIDHYTDAAPFSWVWDTTVNTFAGRLGVPYETLLGETIAHELAHQWDVNPPDYRTGGHCQKSSWDHGGSCLMNATTDADRGNGHAAFHAYLDQSSEYRRIRQQRDPLPQVRSIF